MSVNQNTGRKRIARTFAKMRETPQGVEFRKDQAQSLQSIAMLRLDAIGNRKAHRTSPGPNSCRVLGPRPQLSGEVDSDSLTTRTYDQSLKTHPILIPYPSLKDAEGP